MPNNGNTWIFFIEVCLLSSAVLVLLFKYDLRFDRTIRLNYYQQFPIISKMTSIFKLAVKYCALGYFFTFILVLLWNFVAGWLDWPLLPALKLSDMGWPTLKTLGWFWKYSSGMVVLLALNDIRRCFGKPKMDYHLE